MHTPHIHTTATQLTGTACLLTTSPISIARIGSPRLLPTAWCGWIWSFTILPPLANSQVTGPSSNMPMKSGVPHPVLFQPTARLLLSLPNRENREDNLLDNSSNPILMTSNPSMSTFLFSYLVVSCTIILYSYCFVIQ